jgi:hypothetical protein
MLFRRMEAVVYQQKSGVPDGHRRFDSDAALGWLLITLAASVGDIR